MTTLRLVFQLLLVGSVAVAAALTANVACRHGLDSGRTASWRIYCLGRRWPWVVWVHGALCGVACNSVWAVLFLAIGFASGHFFGAMSDHPDATGAAR